MEDLLTAFRLVEQSSLCHVVVFSSSSLRSVLHLNTGDIITRVDVDIHCVIRPRGHLVEHSVDEEADGTLHSNQTVL